MIFENTKTGEKTEIRGLYTKENMQEFCIEAGEKHPAIKDFQSSFVRQEPDIFGNDLYDVYKLPENWICY